MALSELVFSSTTEAFGTAVVAVVAFLAGTFRREITIRIRTRTTRRFWAPLRANGVCIVLGADPSPPAGTSDPLHRIAGPLEPTRLEEFEPYGLTGLGEALGLMTLLEHLRLLGITPKVAHSASMPPDYFDMNLMLLGGPDTNRITAAALRQERPPAEFVDLENGRTGLRDVVHDTVHEPEFSPINNRVLLVDVGFVARFPSPFNETASVIILAGAYGASTYAAARAVTTATGTSHLSDSRNERRIVFFTAGVFGARVSDPMTMSVIDY